MSVRKKIKVALTGGGTMGSVTPLLATVEELKKIDPNIEYFWFGTLRGPESLLIRHYNIDFYSIVSGKLRRYFSFNNFFDFFLVFVGFFQSLFLLLKLRPSVIVSAGGFVAVPVVYSGWLMGVPAVIHQQDVRQGLSNKLCSLVAKKITACFPVAAEKYSMGKVEVIGNPVRKSLRTTTVEEAKKQILSRFSFNARLPVVLITGGGTGSLAINQAVFTASRSLVAFCQVIHVTGKNNLPSPSFFSHPRYSAAEFLLDLNEIIPAVDLVVARAGMGTFTELAWFSRCAILIPIPDSHQLDNAFYFASHQAVEILQQEDLNAEKLAAKIKNILADHEKRRDLEKAIHKMISWGAEKKLADIVFSIALK